MVRRLGEYEYFSKKPPYFITKKRSENQVSKNRSELFFKQGQICFQEKTKKRLELFLKKGLDNLLESKKAGQIPF